MRISFVAPSSCEAGVLAVLVHEGPTLSGAAAAVDETSGGLIGRALSVQRYRGRLGETLQILAPAGLAASRVLLVGAGPAGEAGALEFEQIGGAIAAALATTGESIVTVMLDDAESLPITTGVAAARLAFGAELRGYRFDRYRTCEEPFDVPALTSVVVACPDVRAAKTAYARLEPVAQGIFLARDLLSEPANVLDPTAFTERMKALTSVGVEVKALGEAALRKLGFGAFLGVSQGSAKEPQLVLLEYDGLPKGDTRPPVVLVGKGVTFDAGGISIKPAAGMETMKWDMGGAGAIAGAIRALALRKARCRVVGVCAMVENMPSGTAQRPGDVVTSHSGRTIEVIDTDCEGRLILCDAISYAQERYRPEIIVDLATLTSAVVTALGYEYGGVFASDDALADQLIAAGQATGDRLWRFPMGEPYDKLLASPIADMKNVAGREASAIIAAQFIRRFVDKGVAWAHLDISGTAWAEADGPLCDRGATGFGVRLLDQYIADNHERG